MVTRPDSSRHRWSIAVLAGVAACAGPAPTQPAGVPSTPAALVGPLTVSGRVVTLLDREPVAGATVRFIRAGEVAAVTDGAGAFVVSGLTAGRVQYSIVAPGLVTHWSALDLADSRQDVELDVIPDRAPFDLPFYRMFVRRVLDQPPAATNPWTTAPSFYLRTVTEESGAAVPPSVVEGIRRVFTHSVPELTAGRFDVAAFEVGTESRLQRDGWVNVTFHDDLPDRLGDSLAGGPFGRVRIVYDPAADSRVAATGGPCGSQTVRVAEHEIVHTMGFYHTDRTFEDFQTVDCRGAGRPARVLHHARVMYARPRLNRDEDANPEFFLALGQRAPGAAPPDVVSCSRFEWAGR